VYVGNLRGLGLAGLPERIRILEEQYNAMAEREASKDIRIASLEAKVK